MKFIYIIYIIAIFSMGALVFAEFIASNYPNGKFCKWWRRNVISSEDDL
jgi:hypothetical protein